MPLPGLWELSRAAGRRQRRERIDLINAIRAAQMDGESYQQIIKELSQE